MKILLDGDIFLYQSSYVVEQVFTWNTDLHSLVSDSKQGVAIMQNMIDDVVKKLGATDMRIAFTGSTNWRKDIYPDYKFNRATVRKPIAFKPMRDWFMEHYPCLMADRLEADDIMGIQATRDPGLVLVSIDKDLRGIPGWLFNPKKDEFPKHSTKAEADLWHMTQTLTGDTTDNYPGCPGIGPVKAQAILAAVSAKDPAAMWAAVVHTFKAKGLTEADALVQAKLARILRDGEWDSEQGECLWEPERRSS